jgi:hypothetical protein
VNAATRVAQVHTYASVAGLYADRFHVPVPFDEAAYAKVVDTMRGVLGAFGLEPTFIDAPARSVRPSDEALAPPAAPRKSRAIVLVIVALVVIAAVALRFWLLHGRR